MSEGPEHKTSLEIQTPMYHLKVENTLGEHKINTHKIDTPTHFQTKILQNIVFACLRTVTKRP